MDMNMKMKMNMTIKMKMKMMMMMMMMTMKMKMLGLVKELSTTDIGNRLKSMNMSLTLELRLH